MPRQDEGIERTSGGWIWQMLDPGQNAQANHLMNVGNSGERLAGHAESTIGRYWPDANQFVVIAFGDTPSMPPGEKIAWGAGLVARTLDEASTAVSDMGDNFSVVRGFDHMPTPEEVLEAMKRINTESFKAGSYGPEVAYVQMTPGSRNIKTGLLNVDTSTLQNVTV